MGGSGFVGGLVEGMQEAQDRQMKMAELKMRQDLAKYEQKHMETQDQMQQLQLQSLQKKIEAETRLPSMQESVTGPQAAPLGEGQQGPMPEIAPEIDRRKLASLLQVAQQAGQDPDQLLQLMGLADPRIQAIHQSLQPEKIIEVKPGETAVGVKPGGAARSIFQSPTSAAKPPDFGDRLESAAASYGQNKYGKPTTFSELLSLDPIQAAVLRQTVMVDEPTEISRAKVEAQLPLREQQLLTPSEANQLGVPFGTTGAQAKGIMPITAHQRESLAGYDTSRAIIADIRNYSEKINTSAGGLRGRAAQGMKLWGAWTQSDPDAALLQSKIGELASVARSLGEKGALANMDVARAAALVPGVLDTREVAQKKIADMLTIINKGEANFRKSLGIDARAPGKSGTAVPPPKPTDPLAHIPVPAGLTPKQEQLYREAYAAEKAKKQKQMNPNAKP